MARWGVWLLMMVLALPALAQPRPPVQPRAPQPRLIVQLGHITPVDAAAIIPPGDFAITADTGDNSVIIWWLTQKFTAEAMIVDRLTLPLLDKDGLFDAQQIESITVAPDASRARLRILAYGPIGDNASAGARFLVDLDLNTRRFSAVGAMQPVPEADVDRVEVDKALTVLPAGFRRDGDAVTFTGADGRVRWLGGTARSYFDSATMSPSGTSLARISEYDAIGSRPARSEVSIWNTRSNTVAPPVTVPTDYDDVLWIDDEHYFVISTGEFRPALVFEAISGRKIGEVPDRCLLAPMGPDGAFVAAGPASCPGDTPSSIVTAEDAIWTFDRRVPGTGFTLDRVWKKRRTKLPASEVVTAIATFGDDARGYAILATTRPRLPVEGLYPLSLLTHATNDASEDDFSAILSVADLKQENIDPGGGIVQQMKLIGDADKLLLHMVGGVFVLDLKTPNAEALVLETYTDDPWLLASDGKTVIVGHEDLQALQRFDAKTGARLPSIGVSGVLAGGYLDGLPMFWAASGDGALRFWDSRNGRQLLAFYSFPGDRWFAVAADGRYDTNLGPDTDQVRWLMPDAPYQALPAQTFMRSHYQPGLMRILLGCIAAGCAKALPPLPDVSGLTRAVPYARIDAVNPGPEPGTVEVLVTASQGSIVRGTVQQPSGLHDVRLFRNNRLVAQTPDGALPPAAAKDDALWRQLTALPMTENAHRVRFIVPVPGGTAQQNFSAYAFNVDRMRGFSGFRQMDTRVPIPLRPRRAIVLTIGVDHTANPDWRLSFAVHDAEAMAAALARLPGRTIVPIVLTSARGRDLATKANISAVLRTLIGLPEPEDAAALARLAAAGVDMRGIAALTPDDIIIMSFSGHGVTLDGEFYLLPSDAAVGGDGKPVASSLMSATELAVWGRRVAAGEVAMIIDACHSAASVEAGGFRPGPMGDPGLGQLAFDKGFRILTATQADNVALEDGRLGHGLLTHALVKDGLGPKLLADSDRDGRVSLDEWLRYGVNRLPSLAADMAAGRVTAQSDAAIARARDLVDLEAPAGAPAPKRPVQQPALFDFNASPAPVVVR